VAHDIEERASKLIREYGRHYHDGQGCAAPTDVA
jgi:hypothetical protein